MSEEIFKEFCQQVIDCQTEEMLLEVTKDIDKYRKSTKMRDFAILQSLVLSKGNELAITNIMEVINFMQIGEGILVEAPPYDERH